MNSHEIVSSGNEAVNDLLSFYRFRLDEFEKERELHLERLETVTPQKDELHRLRWEAKTRDTELIDLRKTVSDAQVSVHKEREIANDQSAMITRLKTQQVDDRKRIQRLLALTQPVTNDITFVQEGSEGAGEALSGQYQRALNNAEEELGRSKGNTTLSAQAVAARLQSRNESLLLTIDSLRDQLESYKDIARDKISTLYEDRNIREQQATKTTQGLTGKVELLTKKLNATEDNLSAVTKDYLVLRHNAQVAQRVMIEEKQILRAEREALEHDRASAARQMSLEMGAAREASQAEIELATNDFRGQVQARERDMAVLREQYENIQDVYASRVRDLEQQLELTKNKYATLNRRRKLEIQGAAASAAASKREIDGLKKSRSGGRSRGGSSDSPPVVLYADHTQENVSPMVGRGEKEIMFLKQRVVEMEQQLRGLLVQE